MDRTRGNQHVSRPEDGNENRRRLSARPIESHESEGGELHHAAYGYRTDIWKHFRAIRLAKRNHRSDAIHDFGEHGNFKCVRAHTHRAEVFPTDNRDDARMGHLYRRRLGTLSVEDVD